MSQSPVENQAGIEKLAQLQQGPIRMELQNKYMGLAKETTAITKERPYLLLEVKAKTYHDFKTMARKFFKIWTGGKHFNLPAESTNILCQVQK